MCLISREIWDKATDINFFLGFLGGLRRAIFAHNNSSFLCAFSFPSFCACLRLRTAWRRNQMRTGKRSCIIKDLSQKRRLQLNTLQNSQNNLQAPAKTLGRMECQKNPRVRKIRVRNSGAGNGCANFMDAWKKCVLSAGKPMSIKFLVLGGGGILGWGAVEVPILILWARGFF